MPELPEIVVYVDALTKRIEEATLEAVRVKSFSLLRTVDPPLGAVFGKKVTGVHRIGKRVVIALEEEWFLVIHLMVAGRLRWHEEPRPIPGKIGLAAFDFSTGTLLLTEAGTRRRASLHVLAGADALAAIDPGGIEIEGSSPDEFRRALTPERHTLKRALTDGRRISGIGGALADEILHAARLSPLQLNTNLEESEIERLHAAARATLARWVEIRRHEAGDGFPTRVTAFHREMAVHGKFGEPCPVCGTKVQRIAYAARETNYCPGCQTGGRVLADRSLSRLLKSDWPQTVEDLEE